MTQPYPPSYGQQPPYPPPPPGPRYPHTGGYYPPPQPPRKTRKWPWIVGGVFGFIVLLAAVGGNSGTSSTAAPVTSTAVASNGTNPPAASASAAPAPVVPAAPTGPQGTFGDGTWVVGEDIVPGTYKSAGAQEGLFEYCQITTHSDDTAESNFLEWKNANANEPVRIKIGGKVKSVKVSGCEDFTKVG